MKVNTAFTIAVCIACFVIGYLCYVGAMFFIDFAQKQFDPCEARVQVCSQELPQKSN